jgi:hypothetical protein
MTFKEMQDLVMGRLNLTSTDARTRIKAELNLRYREVQSSIGLQQTRRGIATFATASGVPTTTQSGIAKIFSVYDNTYLLRPLREITLNQLRMMDSAEVTVGTAQQYVADQINDDVIQLRLYPVPTVAYNLMSDVLLAGVDMVEDSDEPAFSKDFHDVLVHGVIYDELMKLEKFNPLAEVEEAKFEKRLADLRFFLAKSAWISGPKQTDTFLRWGLSARVWPYNSLAP